MVSLIFFWMKNLSFFWNPTCTHHKLVISYKFTCIQLKFLHITKSFKWESLEHLYYIPKDYSFPLRIHWFFASRCVLRCWEGSEFSRLVCSKCHLIKGTAANGSFTLHRFNYLNEVHSKKCIWVWYFEGSLWEFFCDCGFRLFGVLGRGSFVLTKLNFSL